MAASSASAFSFSASNQALAEIVGVVGDVRHNGLTSDPVPTVFLLHAQTPGYITNLVVRTSGDPLAYAAAIRGAIHDADPMQAVSAVGTLDRDVAAVLARPRMQAILVTSFAVIAVILAVIGVYGLIAYLVTQRTHEIGIRLALGATARRIFGELVAEGAGLVVVWTGRRPGCSRVAAPAPLDPHVWHHLRRSVDLPAGDARVPGDSTGGGGRARAPGRPRRADQRVAD